MSKMADPMIVFRMFQEALDNNLVDTSSLDSGYMKMADVVNGRDRFSYAKVVDNELQSLSIFGLEDDLFGEVCYNVGYAVAEKHRGRGLALEAVNFGIEDLKVRLRNTQIKRFYVEAVVDQTNIASIKAASKIFNGSPTKILDTFTNTPALHFKVLVNIN